jgi:hypothetical protein
VSTREVAIMVNGPIMQYIIKFANLSALLILYDLEYTHTIVNLWKTILVYTKGHIIISPTINVIREIAATGM